MSWDKDMLKDNIIFNGMMPEEIDLEIGRASCRERV